MSPLMLTSSSKTARPPACSTILGTLRLLHKHSKALSTCACTPNCVEAIIWTRIPITPAPANDAFSSSLWARYKTQRRPDTRLTRRGERSMALIGSTHTRITARSFSRHKRQIAWAAPSMAMTVFPFCSWCSMSSASPILNALRLYFSFSQSCTSANVARSCTIATNPPFSKVRVFPIRRMPFKSAIWSCVGIHVLSICSATIPIHCVISGRWRSTMSSSDGIVASPTGTATSITLARSATNAAAPILVTAQPFVIKHVKTANGPSASSFWASPLETPGIFVSTSHTMRGSRRPLKLTLAIACTFPSNDLGPFASVVGFFTALKKTSLI
mmetsp:Transcript_99662/g.284914  ORF Transcript_99662/g.284914 Transcript_99662/m.284914 type:complete len:329 (+) Transcript_99662:1045-2031(+)